MKMMKLTFFALEWMSHHLYFSDIAYAMLGLFIFSCVLQKLTNKGPMIWPILGIVPTLVYRLGGRDDIYTWVTKALILSKNGTFHYRGVWMGGAYGIVTVDPSKIKYMLKTKFKNFPKGKCYRERFYDLLGDGIFNADDELWKEQRQIATVEMHAVGFVEYSMKTVGNLVHEKLLKVIEKVVERGGCIDFHEVLLRFTFDNICVAAFGVDPGCLDLDLPDIDFAKAFESATELSLFRFLVPPFVWKPMRFFKVGFEKQLDESIRVVHGFAEKTVTDRRTEFSKNNGTLDNKSDLLSRLIEIESQNKSHFSNNFLRDFCISIILAGRDTSSVGLAWFFWLIYKNPEVESKILCEIYEILGNDIDDSHMSKIVFTEEELKKMVYLQAALSESLRLYPPVPIDLKEAVETDVFPDGTVVKKGTRVHYSIYSMARMESIWGKDCLEFKPERWINNDGKFVSENQFKYVTFNGGPRLCVGKKFAYMQMKLVVVSILLRYSVKVVESHENVVPKMTTTLYMKNGLLVTFEPRNNKAGYKLIMKNWVVGGF